MFIYIKDFNMNKDKILIISIILKICFIVMILLSKYHFYIIHFYNEFNFKYNFITLFWIKTFKNIDIESNFIIYNNFYLFLIEVFLTLILYYAFNKYNINLNIIDLTATLILFLLLYIIFSPLLLIISINFI